MFTKSSQFRRRLALATSLGVALLLIPAVALANHGPATETSALINADATYTNNEIVTVNITAKLCKNTNTDQWQNDGLEVKARNGTTGSFLPVALGTWSAPSGDCDDPSSDPLSNSFGWTLPPGDGNKTVGVNFSHGSGTPAEASDTIILDKTLPTVSITSPSTPTVGSSSITVEGSASDPLSNSSASGLDKVEVRVGGTGGTWQAASGTTSWSLSNVVLTCDTPTLIEARSIDNAGNVSTTASHTVTYNCTTDTARGAPAVVNEQLRTDPAVYASCESQWGSTKSKKKNWRGDLISTVAHWGAATAGFDEARVLSELHATWCPEV